jgi:hypothetical protein
LVVLGLLLAGCEPATGLASKLAAEGPSLIVVRDFRVEAATRVVVDTSFGFSLNRGQPGVPLSQRAAGLARAAAFNIADALTERLRQQGYNAVHADAHTPDPQGKAVIVTGVLREINEGHRRRVGDEHAKIVADAEIDDWSPGIRPVQALHLDSARLADDGVTGPTGQGSAALGAAARRVGREIARYVGAAAGREGVGR